MNYARSHGATARSARIQELLALLCVLNAKVSRIVFSIVLQSSKKFQKEIEGDDSAGLLSSQTSLERAASVALAMSYYPVVGGAPAAEDISAIDPGAATGSEKVRGSHSAVQGMRNRERTMQCVKDSLSICTVELRELLNSSKAVLEAIQVAMAVMHGWSDAPPDATPSMTCSSVYEQ